MKSRPQILLFYSLVAPWLLLVVAWKSKSYRYKHWVLVLFMTIYGATITIAYDPSGAGPDGVRHLLGVYEHYVGLGFDQFMSELWSILMFRQTEAPSPDVYKHVLSYLTGGLLGLPVLFFPIVAFVYGYFFVGSLLEIFKNFRTTKLTYVFLAFALLFFLIKNIEGVNTVRTWTGMWILVYACLKYYATKRTRYILLMFVPPFVHFGFFIMAIPAWLVLVFGNRTRIYAALFVLSSFTTFFNPGTVMEVISVTELGQDRTQAYFREEVVDGRTYFDAAQETGNRIWLTLQKIGLQKWALNIFAYTLLISGVYFVTMTRFQKTLFSIGLLTVTLSNMTWYLYAVSNRSWVIGSIFILAAYLVTRQDPHTAPRLPYSQPVYKAGLHISLLLFIPYLLYNLSTILDFPSVYLFGFPFLVWLSPESNMSVKEALKSLLETVF